MTPEFAVLTAEALAAVEPRSVREFPRADAFAAFDLYCFQAQPRTCPHLTSMASAPNPKRRAPPRPPLHSPEPLARPPPDVTQPPAKCGKRAGPRREAANPIVNLARRPPPVDAPVFLGEYRRVARLRGVLWRSAQSLRAPSGPAIRTRGAPASAMRPASSGAVSSAPISISRCSRIGPVSSPGSSRIVVSPVFLSPLMMAQAMGAAPRYFGSSEACRFIQPSRGISSRRLGMICP